MTLQEREAKLIQTWAWHGALENDPPLQRYNLDCNRELVFSYLDGLFSNTTPSTVAKALKFALQNRDRLENGSLLAAKANSRLQEEAEAEQQRIANEAAEKARLDSIEQENRRFELISAIANRRVGAGATPESLRIEKCNVAAWPLEKLEQEFAAIQLRDTWRGKSAAEFKAGVLDHRQDKPDQLVLPDDFDAQTFCRWSAPKIRIFVKSYTVRGFSDAAVWQAINERVKATRGGE